MTTKDRNSEIEVTPLDIAVKQLRDSGALKSFSNDTKSNSEEPYYFMVISAGPNRVTRAHLGADPSSAEMAGRTFLQLTGNRVYKNTDHITQIGDRTYLAMDRRYERGIVIKINSKQK